VNAQQRQQLYQQLIDEKRETAHRLQQTDHYGLEQGMKDSIGELSSYDNHPADIGTEVFERGKDLALNAADEHYLQHIEDALQRMKTGEYGICRFCHQEIPFARLEAVPATEYCVEHDPHQSAPTRRPVEETVTDFGKSDLDDTEYIGYDGEDAWQDVEQYGTSNPPDFFREGRNYNELVIDHDEQRGYVDLVEGFTISDFAGHTDEITQIVHNEAYERKEEEEMLEEMDTDGIYIEKYRS
jgi:YteA family regulatory protein